MGGRYQPACRPIRLGAGALAVPAHHRQHEIVHLYREPVLVEDKCHCPLEGFRADLFLFSANEADEVVRARLWDLVDRFAGQ